MSTTKNDSTWWRSAVVYQVYPRSFADSNGDGIGDLQGIIDHLDHIAGLGADVIWLSPVYQSPQDDNGYDISDYQSIDPVFGTLDDFDRLLQAAHSRGLKLVMDLVVNHTSDEHPWFIESASSRDNPKRDWYIWRDAPNNGDDGAAAGGAPNNWESFFSGSAWQHVPARDQYYLHLFSVKQPDLNWENPEVRRAIFDMMSWWLDRGVDGFRMDVINLISKDQTFPDGLVQESGFGDGMPFTAYGPRIHEFLTEMQSEVFAPREGTYLTVGEMPGVTIEQAAKFTDLGTGQLNMVFQFEHMDLDHEGSKWKHRPASISSLKQSLGRWQQGLAESGWNSLYWNNHDQPRVVSRFGNDREYWYESATALATVLHLQRGTPYVYQGEEIGMTNVPFTSIDDFRDIETLNAYAAAVSRGDVDLDRLLDAFRRKGRDNARTPMQWSAAPGAGFTDGEPWIPVNPSHQSINAANQVHDPLSVFAYYQRLIALRHSDDVVVEGDFTMLLPQHPQVYAYTRSPGRGADGGGGSDVGGSGSAAGTLLVIANLGDEPAVVTLDALRETGLDATLDPARAAFVLGNGSSAGALGDTVVLTPWHTEVYRWS